MKYLSLALFSVTLTACNVNNEAATKVDISEVDKKDMIEVSNNKALECHKTILDWQIKELAQVPCLTLPISNQDFLDIKKFDNGMFDVKDYLKHLKSQTYYKQLLLGLAPYNDNETFLISFSNDQAEDGYPNQSFHITSIKKDNEKDNTYTIGVYPLGLIDLCCQICRH